MTFSKGQSEFFNTNQFFASSSQENEELLFSEKSIRTWQERIHSHQVKFLKGSQQIDEQTNLFNEITANNLIDRFEPLTLTPLPLNFWRLSKPYHQGPAIYIVMDLFEPENEKNLILYIGETISANQRWKGDHDCKKYLDNYSSTLQQARLNCRLSIRFWTDVPQKTNARRKLEQALIQRWLPPFNKETRTRWQTPFTTDIN